MRGRTAGRVGAVDYVVAAGVLVAGLREAVSGVPHAAPLSIVCTTDDADRLAKVTIEVLAAFDTPLLTLATSVRVAAAARLAEILGDLAPPVQAVAIDIAFTDVTDDLADL